jgi:hypothetical protein
VVLVIGTVARIRNSDVDDALLQSRVSVIVSFKICDKVVCGMLVYMIIVANRVRVAVRLRPRNTEELHADIDFADCVELQPEVSLYNQSFFHFELLFLIATPLGISVFQT